MFREMENLSGAFHGPRGAHCFPCSSGRPHLSGAGLTQGGEVAHVVDSGREDLGHFRQHCRLRSPHPMSRELATEV